MDGRHAERSVRDELFLIAHEEIPGFRHRFTPRVHTSILSAGLAGAVLVDLLLADQIRIAERQVNFHHGRRHGGDPIGACVLRHLAAVQDWLPLHSVVADTACGLYERTVTQLIDDNVLTANTRRFGRVQYRTNDAAHAARALAHPRTRIRNARHGPAIPDPGTDALCALVRILKLQDALHLEFTTDEVTRRIETIWHWFTATNPDPRLTALPDIASAVDAVVGDLAAAAHR